jgi:decaprenylphospho-beta-D-ribofuranose 2-oxidase
MTVRRNLTGWGRTAPTTAEVRRVREPADAVQAVEAAAGRPGRGMIARGLGRAYGDPAQNAGGLVLDMTTLDRIRQVDAEGRTVVVDAGVSLDVLMRTLLPFGLWVPVLPGTAQVTVGGAIAADVHGKNHHLAGSFGRHVRSLELLTADGRVRTVSPGDPETRSLFWATVGGMGLTGVVLRATLAVHAAETAYFLVDTERAANLEDLMERLVEGDAAYPHSVAWFDAMTTGDRLGRAVVTRGRPARLEDLPARLRPRARSLPNPTRVAVPGGMPPGLLNRVTGRAFNELWFRKAPVARREEIQSVGRFFHPLDGLNDWNRLYGPRGFCQYQFVVPDGAEQVFRECAGAIAASGHVSALNVLKRFGPGNESPLSFPREGWTLAVDIPVRPGLGRLLARLDAMVLDAGGRVYLAKDSRSAAETVRAMYPRLDEFERVRREVDPDGVFRSDLSRRLAL